MVGKKENRTMFDSQCQTQNEEEERNCIRVFLHEKPFYTRLQLEQILLTLGSLLGIICRTYSAQAVCLSCVSLPATLVRKAQKVLENRRTLLRCAFVSPPLDSYPPLSKSTGAWQLPPLPGPVFVVPVRMPPTGYSQDAGRLGRTTLSWEDLRGEENRYANEGGQQDTMTGITYLRVQIEHFNSMVEALSDGFESPEEPVDGDVVLEDLVRREEGCPTLPWTAKSRCFLCDKAAALGAVLFALKVWDILVDVAADTARCLGKKQDDEEHRIQVVLGLLEALDVVSWKLELHIGTLNGPTSFLKTGSSWIEDYANCPLKRQAFRSVHNEDDGASADSSGKSARVRNVDGISCVDNYTVGTEDVPQGAREFEAEKEKPLLSTVMIKRNTSRPNASLIAEATQIDYRDSRVGVSRENQMFLTAVPLPECVPVWDDSLEQEIKASAFRELRALQESIRDLRHLTQEMALETAEETVRMEGISEALEETALETARGTVEIANASKRQTRWWGLKSSSAGMIGGSLLTLGLGPVGLVAGATVGGAMAFVAGETAGRRHRQKMDRVVQAFQTRAATGRPQCTIGSGGQL